MGSSRALGSFCALPDVTTASRLFRGYFYSPFFNVVIPLRLVIDARVMVGNSLAVPMMEI